MLAASSNNINQPTIGAEVEFGIDQNEILTPSHRPSASCGYLTLTLHSGGQRVYLDLSNCQEEMFYILLGPR